MATIAHCLFCFETLASRLEDREPLSLAQVEELWPQYQAATQPKLPLEPASRSDNDRDDEDDVVTDPSGDEDGRTPSHLSPPQDPRIARLQGRSPVSRSNASTPSNTSSTSASASSSQSVLSDTTNASSRTSSSIFSFARGLRSRREEQHPLFVTWNTARPRGHKSLRGCIGTFEPHELSDGLRTYSLISAFEDQRFSPIELKEISSLEVDVTLLMNFVTCAEPMDWDIETHGIRISFNHRGRRYSSTYLPDVASEQGWNKEETIVSLMRKAGWNGRSKEWRSVQDLKVVKYQGMKAHLDYATFKSFKDWPGADLGK